MKHMRVHPNVAYGSTKPSSHMKPIHEMPYAVPIPIASVVTTPSFKKMDAGATAFTPSAGAAAPLVGDPFRNAKTTAKQNSKCDRREPPAF